MHAGVCKGESRETEGISVNERQQEMMVSVSNAARKSRKEKTGKVHRVGQYGDRQPWWWGAVPMQWRMMEARIQYRDEPLGSKLPSHLECLLP